MNCRPILTAAFAATFGLATASLALAAAETQFTPSPLALSSLDVVSDVTLAGNDTPAPGSETLAFGITTARDRGRYDSIRYRPRRGSRGSFGRGPTGALSQLHAGFFDPNGDSESAFLVGFRGGPVIDDHIQLGIGIDWSHKSEKQTEVVSRDPDGTTVIREISSASSNFFPIMGFLQVSGGEGMSVIPYGGIGGGYQMLFRSGNAVDPGTGLIYDYDATYGGWGWQAWAGAAVPLSGRARMSGEVFVNNAELERDLDGGFIELVDVDGVGMRFGLAWGF